MAIFCALVAWLCKNGVNSIWQVMVNTAEMLADGAAGVKLSIGGPGGIPFHLK